MSFIFQTPRLRARQLTMDDVDHLQKIFSDAKTMQYYRSTKDRDETKRWIEWNLENYENYGHSLWAIEEKDTGEFVGQCGLVPQYIDEKEEMEVGYLFIKKYWGQGYATEVAKAVMEYCNQNFDVHRFISIIHPDNERSKNVARKLGMSYERTFFFEVSQQEREMFSLIIPQSNSS